MKLPPPVRKGTVIDAPLVTIDLRSFNEQIRNEKPWRESDRNAITVFKTNGLRILLIALHKNAEMTKHTAYGMISLQVLEGQILFTTEEQSVELGSGQMVALHACVSHSVLAGGNNFSFNSYYHLGRKNSR